MWTGNARETVPGTAVLPPTRFIPAKTVFTGAKKRIWLNEERGDRNANYGVVDSVRQSTVSMKGPWYNDVCPTGLWAGIGLPTTSQPNAGAAPTVYQHTITWQDVPPTYTIHRSMDAAAKVYYVPFGALEKFSLHFVADGQLLEFDHDYMGLFAQPYPSAPSPTYSTLLPFAGYLPTIKLVDGAVNQDIIDMQIDYAQKLVLWYPANGTQDFVTVYFGERTVDISLTARFDNDTLYQRFRNNVLDSITFDVQGPLIGKVYTVTLGAPTAGTFTLTYGAGGVTQTTSGITFNATAATVQSALQALTNISTNVTVTGSAGGPYTVSFTGTALNDGNTLTGSGTGLTGGTFSVSAQTSYAQELNLVFPTVSWDTMDHDTSKENVMIKAKGKVQATPGAALFTGFVQNTVTGYTT